MPKLNHKQVDEAMDQLHFTIVECLNGEVEWFEKEAVTLILAELGYENQSEREQILDVWFG
jgi:hypothetical protein